MNICITSTLWNTIECCRGFEDTKHEIRAVHLKLLMFLGQCFTDYATFGLKI